MPTDKTKREIVQQEALERALRNTIKAQTDLGRQTARLRSEGEDLYKLRQKEVDAFELRIKRLKDERALEEQRLEVMKAHRAELVAGGTSSAVLDASIAALTATLAGSVATLAADIDALERHAEASREAAAAEQELNEAGKSLANTIFGINNNLLNTLEAFDKTDQGVKALTQGFIKSAFAGKKWKKTIGAGFLKISELLTAGVMKLGSEILKLAFEQDEAMSSFMKSTGASYEFAAEIPSLNDKLHAAGVTAAVAGKAYAGLYNTFTDFTEISPGMRNEIAGNVALMSELGVSVETSGKILDTAMRSLGLHETAASDMLLHVKDVADATRQPFSKVAQDFAATAPKLTKYGGKMMEVFEGLQEQAKRTGLEINQLLGVTEQFDTFEGAGRAVGRLNAILGGPYLNSIDMLNATDEERIEILQNLTEQAGLNFDQLGRYEQMAIARAMGTDVDTARRMMNRSKSEFVLQQMAQERLADAARKSQTLIDQLKFAFQSALTGMRPLIEEFIVPFIHGLGQINLSSGVFKEKLDSLYKTVMGWTLGLGVLLAIAGGILIATGVGVAIGVPMIMAGLKMAGIGGAGLFARSKLVEIKEEYGGRAGESVRKGRAKAAEFREDIAASGEIEQMAAGGVIGRIVSRPFRGTLGSRLGRMITGRAAAPSSGLAIVGENGPELASMPTGTRVTPAGTTERMVASMEALGKQMDMLNGALSSQTGGSPQPIVLELEGREFAKFVGDALDHPELRRKLLMGYS